MWKTTLREVRISDKLNRIKMRKHGYIQMQKPENPFGIKKLFRYKEKQPLKCQNSHYVQQDI